MHEIMNSGFFNIKYKCDNYAKSTGDEKEETWNQST